MNLAGQLRAMQQGLLVGVRAAVRSELQRASHGASACAVAARSWWGYGAAPRGRRGRARGMHVVLRAGGEIAGGILW